MLLLKFPIKSKTNFKKNYFDNNIFVSLNAIRNWVNKMVIKSAHSNIYIMSIFEFGPHHIIWTARPGYFFIRFHLLIPSYSGTLNYKLITLYLILFLNKQPPTIRHYNHWSKFLPTSYIFHLVWSINNKKWLTILINLLL